ncbi:MAG: ABC transporter substrate-binding protein [Rhodocyclaceae bacterium]|nr:ABC transporter substrate-binding protein [Rhodocyclaceae bacterium]
MRQLLFALILACLSSVATAGGITPTEIRVGSLQDLSGPIASLGVHFRNGTQMRFDAENAKGGVHGRQLKLLVEDTGYDPKRAVLATEKLLGANGGNGIFAVIHNLGSPVVMATMPRFLDAGVLHLFPGAPLKDVYEPVHPLKFGMSPSYTLSVPPAASHLIRENGFKRVGILYQDDDMGREVLRGMDALLAELGLKWCEQTSYKRGATDFASQIARLKAANCDFVVLATVVRETIGAYTEARRSGWQVPMLVTASGYTAQVHQLGGAALDGLYGVVLLSHPYPDGANRALADWIVHYKEKFKAEPNTWDVFAWVGADLFVRALHAAGPQPTPQKVAAALERLQTARDFFGSPPIAFSASDHLALRQVRIAQIRNSHWENITDYLSIR